MADRISRIDSFDAFCKNQIHKLRRRLDRDVQRVERRLTAHKAAVLYEVEEEHDISPYRKRKPQQDD